MLFNWDLSWIQRRFWGQLFEVFASGICVLAVQNMIPELLQIGQICLLICVSVCLSVQLFLDPVLDRFLTEFIRIFRKKITQKRELEPVQ